MLGSSKMRHRVYMSSIHMCTAGSSNGASSSHAWRTSPPRAPTRLRRWRASVASPRASSRARRTTERQRGPMVRHQAPGAAGRQLRARRRQRRQRRQRRLAARRRRWPRFRRGATWSCRRAHARQRVAARPPTRTRRGLRRGRARWRCRSQRRCASSPLGPGRKGRTTQRTPSRRSGAPSARCPSLDRCVSMCAAAPPCVLLGLRRDAFVLNPPLYQTHPPRVLCASRHTLRTRAHSHVHVRPALRSSHEPKSPPVAAHTPSPLHTTWHSHTLSRHTRTRQ